MPIGTIILIILVVLLIGALPTWPYSAGWGPYPAGGLGLVLVVLLILVLLGRVWGNNDGPSQNIEERVKGRRVRYAQTQGRHASKRSKRKEGHQQKASYSHRPFRSS
jgi:hypothetical protein